MVTEGQEIRISNEPEKLAEVLKEMMALSMSERLQMGKRGRRLVEEKCTWEAVVKKIEVGYETVIDSKHDGDVGNGACKYV